MTSTIADDEVRPIGWPLHHVPRWRMQLAALFNAHTCVTSRYVIRNTTESTQFYYVCWWSRDRICHSTSWHPRAFGYLEDVSDALYSCTYTAQRDADAGTVPPTGLWCSIRASCSLYWVVIEVGTATLKALIITAQRDATEQNCFTL